MRKAMQSNYVRALKLPRKLLAGVLALACQAGADAATIEDIVPPPGLYQIEANSTINRKAAGQDFLFEHQRAGATGDEHARQTVAGQSAEQSYKVGKPNRHCIKHGPLNAKQQAFILNGMANCPNQADKMVGPHTLVHTAQCPTSKVTLTITKLDSLHWDYETRIETVYAQHPADLSTAKQAFEYQAKHGATEAARKEAAAQLARLPALQQQLNAARAQQTVELQEAIKNANSPEEKAMMEKYLAIAKGQTPAMSDVAVVKERWTRIANMCN